MNRLFRHIMWMLLTLLAIPAMAGDITTLDWNEMQIDSVLPVYTEVVPLESDYRQYEYRVALEYPEWVPLDARETQVAERSTEPIGEDVVINSHVGVMRRCGQLDISFIPVVKRDGRYLKLHSCRVTITPVPRKGKAGVKALAPAAERYTRTSKLSEGRWVKISITEDGMYRLTASALRKMGFSKLENVHLYGYGGHRLPEVIDPATEYDDLEEVPLYHEDGSQSWLFYGNGLIYWNDNTRVFNPYARQACYFLHEEDGPSVMAQLDAISAPNTQTYYSFTDHVLYEKDEYAWFSGGRNLYDGVNFANSSSHFYKLNTHDSMGDEMLTVSFSSSSKEASTLLTTRVNSMTLPVMKLDSITADFTWATMLSRTFDVRSSANDKGEFNISLSINNRNDARLDYLALHYSRQITPHEGQIAFSRSGNMATQFVMKATSRHRVMRLSEPGSPATLMTPVQKSDTLMTLVVDDPSRRYVLFDPSYNFPEPSFAGTVENQNLHALDSIDMVIIIPTSNKLRAEAERLAEAHRQYDGLRVAVVKADQIYNEFSSGTPDATAYRRLMKMLYDRAEGLGAANGDYDGPRYLLLMGDAAWDNRMLSSGWRTYNPDDYLLCFESENSYSDTRCYVMEDYFGLLDDGEGSRLTDEKTDLGVGRFPVTDVVSARVMVDKCIRFMSNANAGNWKNLVMMLGDDGDANSHMDYCNRVAEQVIETNPGMEVRKVMWDAYNRVSSINHNTYPEVTMLVKDQMEQGAMVFNYTGHGNTYCLSHEFVLQLEDFVNNTTENPGLWVTAACDIMPFDGQSSNIGEQAVLNPSGGALAFYGTTRTVYASNNLMMNRYFMRYLLGADEKGKRYRMGDAVRLAKNYLITGMNGSGMEVSHKENKLHYVLLGDPALTLGAPLNRVVLDSINGIEPAKQNAIQMKAGDHIRLTGHVEDASGAPMPGFDGIITARLYDNLETVVCFNNAKENVDPFTFTNRNKILYSGQDSIQAGRFEMTFVVPVDINYSDQSGRLVFYAINNAQNVEANGHNEDFNIGGVSNTLQNDTIGPSIVAYLNNDADFLESNRVNASPYFVAQLSDQSGINYGGSGIGHDLLLVIDNDPSKTYVLNNYFTSEFGDFTSGRVAFSIPTLEEGHHTLTFRAWDVLNNTSVTTLDFEVDHSLQPQLLHLSATRNPAITDTEFLLAYNRPGSECTFTFQVFDFAGREMWRKDFVGRSSTGAIAVPWNLCNNTGGRLFPGIYLYRATVTCDGSKEVSKSQKLIIH